MTNFIDNNIEIEQVILGTFLSGVHGQWDWETVEERLQASHFTNSDNRYLYQAMKNCFAENDIVEFIMVKDFIKEKNIQDYALKLITDSQIGKTLASTKQLDAYVNKLVTQQQINETALMLETIANDVREGKPFMQVAGEIDKHFLQLDNKEVNLPKLFDYYDALGIQKEKDKLQNSSLSDEILSGFYDLDSKIGGFSPSDLIIIAARPSMGKTALATKIALNVAKAQLRGKPNGAPVLFFTLEMSGEQLRNRIQAIESKIPAGKHRKVGLTNEEIQKRIGVSKDLLGIPLYIDETSGVSINSIRMRAKHMKKLHQIGLIVVDYLQMINVTDKKYSDNRVQEVSAITSGLKSLAKDLNIPVIALSQLSRKVEDRDDKKPLLSDLRDSGTIEQDADVVMFLYREEYYLSRAKQVNNEALINSKGKADLMIRKHRHDELADFNLAFNAELTDFTDI
jgi:replicative DNA helicase